MVERLTKPVEQIDREKLVQFCDALDVTHCDEVKPRAHTRVAGEVSSVRVVPRAGAPSLEVTVSDGRGSVVGVFFGRRKLAGLTPGADWSWRAWWRRRASAPTCTTRCTSS